MKKHYGEIFKAIILVCVMFAGLTAPTTLLAVPINAGQAKAAVETFLTTRFPAVNQSGARTVKVKGSSRRAVAEVAPLLDNNITVGYITNLQPSGYVLVRADDEVPPVKIYTENGTFDSLPPEFLKVIKLELTEELQSLSVLKQRNAPIDRKFKDQWSALLNPLGQQAPLNLPTSSPGVVLLTTVWNQDAAYNYYCPAAISGPGGRAYTGCAATALAQILRYHSSPIQVSQDHTYMDNRGSCTGSHSISDAGMGTYDWANMPASITTSSPLSEQQAVGQLMYHAGVALESNYEGSGTSAIPAAVPGVLSNYFGYTSGPIEGKSSFTSSQWYSKISAGIDAGEPVFYAMWQADGSAGHAVVCDGYRNGNEIHLNMGWSGSGNLWYNIDTVSYWVYTWTVHAAVFDITPLDLDGDGYNSGVDCDDSNAAIYPGATEVCDGKDNNCNGEIDEGFDADGDGYTTCNGDCDDNDPLVNPGMSEVTCNGKDDDCNPATPDIITLDLYISAVTAPGSATTGQTISVSDTTNKSGCAMGGTTTKIYLSTDNTYNSGDAELGSRAVPVFGAGAQSSTGSTNVTIPASTPAGSYYIIARADANGVIAETYEGNNNRAVSITIISKVDLYISGVFSSGSANAGDTISASDTTNKSGSGVTDTSATRIYLSTNNSYSANDTYLGERAVPAFGAGVQSSSGSTNVTIPANACNQAYYLIARADADGVIGEWTEGNNTRAVSIQITNNTGSAPLPDFYVSSISAPGSANAGGTILVSDTTNKGGSCAAGASTTKIYLSTNNSYSSNDTYLGSRAVPAFGAGAQNSSGSTSVIIPADTPSGNYYIIGRADANGVIAERNEWNNNRATLITITSP